MAKTNAVRQTITLPAPTARRVKALARARAKSASRVMAELVEAGLAQQERERQEFMAKVARYRRESDPAEVERLGEEIGRAIFGR